MKTKFYTGHGDAGESNVGKKNLSKNDSILAFVGELDELNSWLGFCRVAAKEFPMARKSLRDIQQILFIAQAEVAEMLFGISPKNKVRLAYTDYLEKLIKKIDKEVPQLTKFVISGGTELSARLDVARAIARRVERSAVIAKKQIRVTAPFLKFLNRLSSALFALARYANHASGIKEEHPTY